MKHLFKLLLIVLIAFGAQAQDGKKMTFQGSLFQADQPFSGTAELEFTIALDSATSWSETISDVNVINGLYSVVLGETTPLPEDLFYDADERMMSVSVDGVALGDVTLYAPFSSESSYSLSNNLNENFRPTLSVYQDGDNGNNWAALEAYSEADSSAYGVYGQALGNGRNTGMYGYARSINGVATGILGTANVTNNQGANFSTGVSGRTSGELMDSTQHTVGVYGQNTVTGGSEAWGTGGFAGGHGVNRAFRGRANSLEGNNAPQYGAWLQANGGGSGEHFGSWSRAAGTGKNVGVYGTADGGTENWAGWFDGDLRVTGQIISDAGMQVQLPLDMAGPNGNRSVMLSSEGENGNDGTMRLSDSSGFSRVTLFANRFENMADSAGNSSRNYTGAGGAWFGGANGSMGAYLSSGGFENSQGFMELGDQMGAPRAKMAVIGDTAYTQGMLQLTNDQNGMMSSLYSNQLRIGDTLAWNRLSARNLLFYTPDGGYPGWFGTLQNSGFSQLIGYDESNQSTGAILTGFWGDGKPKIYIEDIVNDSTFVMKSLISLDDHNAGRFQLNGQGVNIELGAKSWENQWLNEPVGTELPYFKMVGHAEVPWFDDKGTADTLDDESGTYKPDLVWMDAQKWENGTELGHLTLRSTDGTELNLSPYGIEGWTPDFKSKEFILEHEWSDQKVGNIVGLQNGSQINLGGLMETTDTTTYGGGFSAGSKFWEGNPQLGYIHLRGTVNQDNYFDANMKFALEAVNHGDWEGAEFRMFGNNLDENNAAKPVLHMSSIRDEQGQFSGEITGSGPSSPNFALSAKTWEDNGVNRPFLRMNGADQVSFINDNGTPDEDTDDFEDFYHPDLVWMEVQKWENGTELGNLVLRGTDGSEFGINSHGFTSAINDLRVNNSLNVNANNAGFSVNVSNDPNGSDPDGYTTEVFMNGDETPNIQMGGKPWENGDLAFFQMFGANPDGNGWYFPSARMDVGHDTNTGEEWGSMSLEYNDGTSHFATINLDGRSGTASFNGQVSAATLQSSDGTVSASDARYKEKVQPINNALESTLKLNGYTYFWNKFAQDKNGVSGDQEQIGVIAQELEEVFPQLVKTNDDGYKAVNYAAMTAVLIEAVKELNAKIENLETENTDLKAQLEETASLESRLAQIEKLLGVKTNESSSANNK